MTAINMMVQARARAGFIIADGAITHPDGRMIEQSSKVLYGHARFPWAMGVTGNVHPRTMLATLGSANPLSLKQLIKRLPDAMRAAIARTAAETGLPASEIVLALVGVVWDFAAKRPSGFLIASDPSIITAQEAEPFAWYDTAWNIAGAELGDPSAQLGRHIDLTDPASFDPETDGLALIDGQRRAGITPTVPGCDPSIRHRIGGEIDLIEVTKSGVRAWMLHAYPDKIGEPINPDG